MRKETLADGVDLPRAPRPSMLRQDVTSIYTLSDPDTQDVRYVGKTDYLPARRLTFHLTQAKSSRLPSGKWIMKLAKNGKRPILTLIETVPTGGDWVARERFWIAHFRAAGKLLNLADGGEGLAGVVRTPEHRQKIAAALRTGSHFDCEVCGQSFWRKLYAIKRGENRFCSRACSNRRHR